MGIIWGVWRRDSAPVTDDLARMATKLTAGNVLSAAVWQCRGIGLGFRPAPTLPEDDHDRQPICSAEDGSVFVADARIDNRSGLCHDLDIAPPDRNAMADSTLLWMAWRRWGETAPDHVVGEFAFAVWEPRRQRLVCGRDHMGYRAVYYFEQGPLFAFASFPRGLLALPCVPRELDETSVIAQLGRLSGGPERSFFRGVKRFPSGHFLVADADGVGLRRYWGLDTGRRIRYAKAGEYVEAFREVFDTAVECRLRGRGAVGTTLSGGFDSSSVTVTAARLLAERGAALTAFTGVPDSEFASSEFRSSTPADVFGDERSHASAAAAMYPNIEHVFVQPFRGCPLDLLDDRFRSEERPSAQVSSLPFTCALTAALADSSLAVVLHGQLGNETISYDGMSLPAALVARGRWIRWMREAIGLKRVQRLSWRAILARTFKPLLSGTPWGRGITRRDLLAGNILNPVHIARLIEMERSLHEGRPGWRTDTREFRADWIGRNERPALVSEWVYKAGIDFRDPTFDKRVVEFCLAIPEEHFLSAGVSKPLLRAAMAERLPKVILDERRRGRQSADWYLRVAPYRERFAEIVDWIGSSATAREYLDIPRMRRLVDEWPQGWNDWKSREVYHNYLGLCRGISMGHFIRRTEAGI